MSFLPGRGLESQQFLEVTHTLLGVSPQNKVMVVNGWTEAGAGTGTWMI